MIYLDHHAATPLADGVKAAMAEALELGWANPSSVHGPGRAARRLLETARDRVAEAVGARPTEVVLTGGGTEAVNLAIEGLHPRRIITTEVEHPALAAAIVSLETRGVPVDRLPVPKGAPPNPAMLRRLLGPEAVLAVQWINHETGTVFPIEKYAELVAETGARIMIDATQALGKQPVEVARLGRCALALASQKLGGPGGAGAVVLAEGLELQAIHHGGEQERGRRPGTPDLAAAVGFGVACTARNSRLAVREAIGAKRDALEGVLLEEGGVRNAADGPRVETVSSVAFQGMRSDALVAALDIEGVAVSAGAACSSGLPGGSPVIEAMHRSEAWRATATLRVSLGPEVSTTDVEAASDIFRRVLSRFRGKEKLR
ncbi:MAG: aminotransferase class V-fold PLP-dependent enzyme [Myxococcota bacterium]